MRVQGQGSRVEGQQPRRHATGSERSEVARKPSTLDPRPSTRRSGLTLYEVLLALSIMLVSMSILSGHVTLGSRAAVTANLRSEAALLCETKLNEVVAGIEPLGSGGGPLESAVPGNWTWSMTSQVGVPHVDVVAIEVVVERADEGGGAVRYSLRRIIRDPALFSDAAAAEAAEEVEE